MSDPNPEIDQYVQALADIELILSIEPDNKEALESKDALLQIIEAMHPTSAHAGNDLPTISHDEPALTPATSTSNQPSTPVNAPLAQDIPTEKFSLGMRVLAKWEQDNEFHIARIEKIEGTRYQVTYLQDGTISDVFEKDLCLFEPHSMDLLIPGQAVLALGDVDDLFYEAVIEGQGQAGFGSLRVRFKADRSRSDVSRHDIFIPVSMRDKRVKIASSLAALDPKNAQFVIPEYLKFQETDTEADRKVKRMKVRKLQQSFNTNVAKAQDVERVNSWKNFKNATSTGVVASSTTTSAAQTGAGAGTGAVSAKRRIHFTPVSSSKGVKRR